MRKILFVLLNCCIAMQVYAQKVAVTRTLFNEKGETLIGAIVKVKNGSGGTVTNIQGKFSIAVAPGSILTINYICYNSTDVSIGACTADNVNKRYNYTTVKQINVP